MKTVITSEVSDEEWEECLDALQPFSDHITLVVQPVTPQGELAGLDAQVLIARARAAMRLPFRVLVLPQVHRQLGVD